MKGIYETIGKVEMIIAKYALFVLSFLVFAAAVMRLARYPINWANDVATFLFAWCVFLGGDIAIRKNRLFRIVLLTSKFSPKTQLTIQIVNFCIIGLFLIGMIGYGSWLSFTTRLRTFQGIPGFSYTWVTLSVPIGCASMLVTAIIKIKEYAKAIREGAKIQDDGSVTELV
jgi:TRAP-type C4-dicarboxylate transport system permease small subunit